MTNFNQWLDFHCQTFPGFAKWLKANPKQADLMQKVLGHLSLHQLKTASESMYVAEDQPNGYSKHARWIRQACRPSERLGNPDTARGPQLIDDQYVARCARCMDYGYISVISPKSLQLLRDDLPGPITSCAIVCNCEAGDGLKGTRWARGRCLIPYHHDRHVCKQRLEEYYQQLQPVAGVVMMAGATALDVPAEMMGAHA